MSQLLSRVSPLEREVYDIISVLEPTELYKEGRTEFAGKIFICSRDNIESALKKIASVKKKCKPKDLLIRKYLDSVETRLSLKEPGVGVGQITYTLLFQHI